MTECRDVPEMDYYEKGLPDRFAYHRESLKLPKSFVDDFHRKIRKEKEFDKFQMPWAGHLKFDGRLIPASRLYGCFVTMSSSYNTSIGLPENFKVSLSFKKQILLNSKGNTNLDSMLQQSVV